MAHRKKRSVHHGRFVAHILNTMEKPDYHKYVRRPKIGTDYVLKVIVALCVIFALGRLLLEFFSIFVEQAPAGN